MRWYDYVVCVVIADFAAGAIMAGSWAVVFPVLWYLFYEDFRKWQVSNKL
jgi:hypothetical protein